MQEYEQWKDKAIASDERSGAAAWKNERKSDLYDYQIIQRRFNELKEIRHSGDAQRLLFYFKEGLHGNMAGMGAPKLYTHAQYGTKKLITDYADEVVLALEELNNVNPRKISEAEKVTAFRRASLGFGRTALLLSGAGSLGAFHLGVIRALNQHDLLPRVISGASTGAFVAALLGSHSRDQLNELLTTKDIVELTRFHIPTTGRRNVDLYDLEELLRRSVPDLTFEEAYEVSGLHINISIAPQRLQQRSRLLNATTAPNACIREAVLASCAIPGMFPAVQLKAKDQAGDRKPYIPSRSWIDGSVMDELPSKRLARLYGINYFISSQANPLLLSEVGRPPVFEPFKAWSDVYVALNRQWLKSIYPTAMRQVENIYPMNVLARNWFSRATNEYSADINILPKRRYLRTGAFYETLTPEEIEALITEGEQSTWPRIEHIRVTTAVSRSIDKILLQRNEDCLLP